ncbi:VWA domain-containing protein [Nocardioides sp. zg-1308]|uniref:vWA domain-containing protein n=1 Tax=Nocardioides sp. zg-1308 TaxID=2736253 RepID=UPI0015557043|nr:VWA domain-containing protein [Nocardioides sp. zg-1308]
MLLLDTSGSMRTNDKIEVLNDSVREMIGALKEADARTGSIRLSLVAFGGEHARVVLAHTPVAEVAFTTLEAGGRTPLGQAFARAQELISDTSALPSNSHRPTIALVSDGIPNQSDDWREQLSTLLASSRGAKATRFALGVGEEADREMLAAFSGGLVHRAGDATRIRTFLQFVTMTVTEATVTGVVADASSMSGGESIDHMVWQDDDF